MVDNYMGITYNVNHKVGFVPLYQEDFNMRKIISILLVTLMLFSLVAVSASAALCECGNHKYLDREFCNCCINCPDLDPSLVFDCENRADGTRKPCCADCEGFAKGVKKCSCNCDCIYCTDINDGYDPDASSGVFDEFITNENTTSIFQAFLNRISSVFDTIFGILYSLLGIK